MTNLIDAFDLSVHRLPRDRQRAFLDLGRELLTQAGDNVLGLSAVGGWIVQDPLFRNDQSRSVVVLQRFDLPLLDRFAATASRLGRRGIAAPLVMTPAYIASSCDTFPLELLEIRTLHVVIRGADHFCDLKLDPADVRRQCERELKSELIHLRQGLLAVAGRHRRLTTVIRAGSERMGRVLRGIVELCHVPQPLLSAELVSVVEAATNLKLPAMARVFRDPVVLNFHEFEAFYADVAAIAAYADAHGKRAAEV